MQKELKAWRSLTMLKYSYLPPVKQLTVAIMREFQIEHYLDLINSSHNPKQIVFLFNQILKLLNLNLCTQQSECLLLQLGLY